MTNQTIIHYGTPRKSGRYPYGSGKEPRQRGSSFRSEVLAMKKQGMSEKDIAAGMGISTTALRQRISLEKAEQRAGDISRAQRLKDHGYSNVQIGEKMGINESSVRSLLAPGAETKAKKINATAEMLKAQVEDKRYLDVGAGVELQLGVSRTALNTTVAKLEEEGYKTHYLQVQQLGTGKNTSLKVLTKDDVEWKDVNTNKDQIRMVTDWSEDGGYSYLGIEPVKSVSSKRVLVRFVEDGGADMDGVIQLRPGTEDLTLGGKRYAQVRIGVDDSHYLKGMAIFDSEGVPDGYDMVFNTNKSKADGKMGAMKKMKDDPDNPFGATIRQTKYVDVDGNEHLSPINIVGFHDNPNSGAEGSWDTWSKSLSSQVLSKQSPMLAKKQLDLDVERKKSEFEDILALTNPAVKQKMLDSFADDCDSRAVDLKAAAMPRQTNKVLIPLTSLKENEVYSQDYKNGETVNLIRHPHGGIFEIGVGRVNNKNEQGKRLLGDAKDAIGIHPKMAEKLSGADFDGDTVIVIPGTKHLQTSPSLTGLKGFDPKTAYPKYDGMEVISSRNKQAEMGKVSNLITDMTIKGASHEEIARAVRHSMVVIDAEKHELNYKQSYKDNGIAALKVQYQGGTETRPRGASTLISRAGSTVRVDTRRPVKDADIKADPKLKGAVRRSEYSVDPKTGKKMFVTKDDDTYTVKTKSGKEKTVHRQVKSSKMYEVDDAMKLSSGTMIEQVYGEYANTMKSMANRARLVSIKTPNQSYSPSAKKVYSEQVRSLRAKLNIANSNKPVERQAQLLANSVVKRKRNAKPDMDAAEVKKLKGQALVAARERVNARKQKITITDKEWEAIQAGAVSHNVLTQILSNADLDHVKALSTPRTTTTMSSTRVSRARLLVNKGYTRAEIADFLGVSVAALASALSEEE